MPTTFTIIYERGGSGFGLEYETLGRIITLDQDGNVKIEVSDKNSKITPVEYKVDKEKAKEEKKKEDKKDKEDKEDKEDKKEESK